MHHSLQNITPTPHPDPFGLQDSGMPGGSPPERESVKVLRECIELQIKKSRDYQNPNSRVKQAHYYPWGIKSLMDIINTKYLRTISVIEAMENDPNYVPNFESVEDSLKDMINYCSFAVALCRGKIDGQDPDRDFLNRPKMKISYPVALTGKAVGAQRLTTGAEGVGKSVVSLAS